MACITMNKYTVYLCGSVVGHPTLADANKWREKATSVLETAGYKVLNPLRGREDGIKYPPNEIVLRDLLDIMQSDIILVEMDNPNTPYIGTSMEIREAYRKNKEIIIWGKANRNSYWLQYHATKWFDTLEDALKYLVRRVENK